MPADRSIVVIRVYSDPMLLPDATLVPRVTVEFKVGSDGPFAVTLPASEFSAERARALMEEKAAEIRKIYGGY
jgi:hypothetical protein